MVGGAVSVPCESCTGCKLCEDKRTLTRDHARARVRARALKTNGASVDKIQHVTDEVQHGVRACVHRMLEDKRTLTQASNALACPPCYYDRSALHWQRVAPVAPHARDATDTCTAQRRTMQYHTRAKVQPTTTHHARSGHSMMAKRRMTSCRRDAQARH